MPRKTKTAATATAALPSIPKELIDQFVTGPMSAEAVQAASMAFKKALIERALGGELSHHLGYPAGPEARGREQPTQRPQRQDRSHRGRAAAGSRSRAIATASSSRI